jgi:hypothetical protein
MIFKKIIKLEDSKNLDMYKMKIHHDRQISFIELHLANLEFI